MSLCLLFEDTRGTQNEKGLNKVLLWNLEISTQQKDVENTYLHSFLRFLLTTPCSTKWTKLLELSLETLSPQRSCEEPTVDDINLHYLKDPKLWELWYIPY